MICSIHRHPRSSRRTIWVPPGSQAQVDRNKAWHQQKQTLVSSLSLSRLSDSFLWQSLKASFSSVSLIPYSQIQKSGISQDSLVRSLSP